MPFTYVQDGKERTWTEHPFDATALAVLENFLKDKEVVPLREVARGNTEAVAMRHDVDHSMEHALKFAVWEHKRGIRSTYFLLHSAWYWDASDTGDVSDFIEALTDMHHEVGIHNDAMSVAFSKGHNGFDTTLQARAILTDAIEYLRQYTEIVGAADHGGARNNTLLWDHYPPEDFDLEYEAYQLKNAGQSNYISDNRGEWRSPLEHIEGKQTHILIHPCHWDV